MLKYNTKKLGKFFIDSERCSEMLHVLQHDVQTNLKYGGNASLALGDGRP